MINQVDFFKCLSDQTRLNILKLVLNKQNICVCELTEQLELSQPKISRHLALLRTHGILLDARQGQWVYYSVNPDLPNWAVEVLKTIANQDESLVNQSSSQFSSISTYCE
ncbi:MULTISPECIES: metalloregulator ArsR/SmtB family transcription factor [Acinetobacter]|jgi:ArsR family transcriptional regulator|uniref:Metalloregulator ArsR/SmtB family transcription factor n=1 Tax=Acinetobacter pittii TaxID=48296 RepID=A0AAE9S713_ACIPI|nr:MULTISPECIES: metalloregulator ArsR/SmtB family transcription factor [Acinetobacter]AZP29677.1 HTH domain-containing protein [Acinetobacter pittii]EKK08238.1 transcriptional regulator, ArsR family [Acinetobacter baumannii Naval-72]EXE27206.1 bacterial regulatory, arsR family protein [Acinetobacter sp. 907131]EXS16864.1 bacterial regulatory, arsR family protein [Acinetobacter sp. 883425]MBJ6351633.1 metalloregulator ArsR/SmtB family transcription factor [Acinetobacter sp. c1]